MAVPLVLSFVGVDYIYRPDLVWDFFKVRLLIIPAAVIIGLMIRTRYGRGHMIYLPSLLFCGFLGMYSAYLTYRTGGDNSPYYAGLNLIAIGALSFLPWPSRLLPIAVAVIYGPHFATLFWDQEIHAGDLVPQIAFMGSTIFLSMITHFLTANLRRAEVTSKLQLKTEIETKDQVIEDKTRHGIFLEKLAMQFSPQVVDAIKGGTLDLNDRRRQAVTCIFLDVENSTSRSSRLDYGEYSNLLSEFFSDCIDVFLKHDVTVGTYLGDGLMAFSNAPLKQVDHQKIALNACLDILRLHERKRHYYDERWRSEFNIRIGINTGYALVGFFPNATRGTYTAIGDVVNLASRLCGKGAANSICVTKSFLRDMVDNLSNLAVETLGTLDNLKGFEGERFDLFAVRTLPSLQDLEFDSICPLCSGKLSVSAHLGQTDLIRCASCGFQDFRDQRQSKAA